MTFQLGDYQAQELIGAGGSAQVWRGSRGSTGTVVALKIFPPDGLAAARREAALAAAVDHPHVVTVLDVVTDGDRVALITEYAAGGNLRDLLDRRGRLSPAETLTVLLPLAAALATAHERHIVHGDISAGNVVFDLAGRPLLADLGAGRAAVELSLPVSATACDAAPELARGGSPTPASDMFSLGSLALACLTGHHAWPADDLRDVMIQAAAGQWPDLDDAAAPPAMVALVRSLLQHDPDRRPGGAALVMDLRAIGRPEPIGFEAGPFPRAFVLTESPASPADRAEPSAPVPAGSTDMGRRPEPRSTPAPEPSGGGPLDDKSAPSSRAFRGWGDADESDAARMRRSRAITRIRPDAVPRQDAPDRKGGRPFARSAMIGACVVVVLLAAVGGLWWAGAERTDPLAGVAPVATASVPRSSTGPSRSTGHDPVPAAPTATAPTTTASTETRPSATTSGRASMTSAQGGSVPPPRGATSGTGRPTAASPAPAAVDWATTVRLLDVARAKALMARDPALLDAVYTKDSAARAADAKVISSLTFQGMRVSGAQHVVSTARAVGSAPVRVAVHDSLPSYSIVDAAGSVVGKTAARSTASRVLVLVRTAAGYRISDVLPS